MARLLDFFSPVFSFGLELDERIAAGTAGNGAAEVQEHARRLIAAAKAAALAAGKRPEHVESACFAVVSWSTRSSRATPRTGTASRHCRSRCSTPTTPATSSSTICPS